MIKYFFTLCLSTLSYCASAQDVMTPETLWSLGRVEGVGKSADGKPVVYGATQYNITSNKKDEIFYYTC